MDMDFEKMLCELKARNVEISDEKRDALFDMIKKVGEKIDENYEKILEEAIKTVDLMQTELSEIQNEIKNLEENEEHKNG